MARSVGRRPAGRHWDATAAGRCGELRQIASGLERSRAPRGCPSKRAARQPVIGLPRPSLLHRLYLQTPASLHAACRVACVLATSPLVTNSARASLYWVAQLANDAAP